MSRDHTELAETLARIPVSRVLLAVAVAGPALWLGGVKPWVVPVFALVVFGLLLRRCLRSQEPLRVPAWWWLGIAAAGFTALQCVPAPPALLRVLAPGLMEVVAELSEGTGLGEWNRLSVHPGQTGLEAARLLALTGLFVAAAQLSWRLVVTYVGAAGTLVALIGLAQKLAGAEAIYGIYVPRQELAGLGQALGSPLLTTFVNPNHQSALLLVGGFAAAAAALDLRGRSQQARGREAQRLEDRAYVAWGSVAIQATALVLSMSRAGLVSFGLVGVLALALAARPAQTGSHGTSHGRRQLALAGVIVTMVGMLALAASQGAWQQLASLADPSSFYDKLRIAREGAALIPLSPVVGIGRGAFVDLFPLVDGEPGRVLYSHLESTPVALVVEWGPIFGGGFVLGLTVWWAKSFLANGSLPRRMAMLGLLAVAIQNGADFSLDYLGVAAPCVALAGSLAVSGVGSEGSAGASWPTRRVAWVSAGGLALCLVVAVISIPGSWSPRRARDHAVMVGVGEGSALDALRQTPLDPALHVALAREHALAGEWEASLQRASAATRLRPFGLDGRLLAAVAAAELGHELESIEHLRLGLEAVREPVPPALVQWLIEGTPDPQQLAVIAPRGDEAWAALTRAMARSSVDHALALARARVLTHPLDPEPLQIQARLALEANNPGLALHHARMLVVLRPNEARSHRLRAEARFAHPSKRERWTSGVAELEAALDNSRLDDPAVVEELLVRGLIRLGDADSLARAQEVMQGLLSRRASPPLRRRREALAAKLAEARVSAAER